MILVSLTPQKNPETGRTMMVPVEGSEKVPADLVLIAAGFLGCQDYVADAFGVERNARTNVATEAGSYKTNVDKVFVAGDMHRGQSLVVWAIREGRSSRSGRPQSDGIHQSALNMERVPPVGGCNTNSAAAPAVRRVFCVTNMTKSKICLLPYPPL